MAYKKYIRKGGKLYGPYIYHSRREGGKVISEYHGVQKESKGLKFLWIVLGVLFVIALISLVDFPRETLTGRAIVNLDANYQEFQSLEGKLKFSLREGELVPASSKIVFENQGNIFEYDLKNVVSDEFVEGDFYVEGLAISGAGEGYGISGEKEIFPTVHFILSVLSREESENITEEPPEGGAPITGGVIGNFFGRLTGNVIAVIENEIEGEVSVVDTFTYILEEGETAEIKPRSVRTDFEQLSDGWIFLTIEGNEVIVNTDYSEFEKGFGEEYLGGVGKELVIDLSELGLVLEPGDLKVSLINNQEEIVYLTTNLGEGKVDVGEIISEEPEQEEPAPEQTPTEPKPTITITSINLTDLERAVLIGEFGNAALEVKEAKLKKGFIVVRYELGTYWVEHSYREELDNATLESFMERDRIKWLKDIAKRLSEETQAEEQVEGLVGSYGF